MSTRCQIGVNGNDCLIYKHSDGYPGGEHGVLEVLAPAARTFADKRGNDPEYALAQIMRAFARKDEERRKEMLAYYEEEDTENELGYNMAETYKEPRMTGWGITTSIHGDIEYFYWIDLEKRVIEIYHLEFGSVPGVDNMVAQPADEIVHI